MLRTREIPFSTLGQETEHRKAFRHLSQPLQVNLCYSITPASENVLNNDYSS